MQNINLLPNNFFIRYSYQTSCNSESGVGLGKKKKNKIFSKDFVKF